jgi:hypothetical protein
MFCTGLCAICGGHGDWTSTLGFWGRCPANIFVMTKHYSYLFIGAMANDKNLMLHRNGSAMGSVFVQIRLLLKFYIVWASTDILRLWFPTGEVQSGCGGGPPHRGCKLGTSGASYGFAFNIGRIPHAVF